MASMARVVTSILLWSLVAIPLVVEGLQEQNVVHITCGNDHCAVLVLDLSPSVVRLLAQQFLEERFNNKDWSDVKDKNAIDLCSSTPCSSQQ